MWFDTFVAGLLRSPLHGLLSGSTMLITVIGRRSGKAYSTPVNYVRVGQELWTVSLRTRTWWRNLRGGAPVSIRLRGQTIKTNARVVENQAGVEQGLAELVQNSPAYGRFLRVQREADGRLNVDSVRTAAQARVLVKVRVG